LVIFSLIVSCSDKDKSKNNETKVNGDPDTIKTDYYKDLIIFEIVKPQEVIYKYPDGKTPVKSGRTNEFIKKSIFMEKPSLEKMREIFNFYKLTYMKRAEVLNKELTLDLWFFDKRIPKIDANPYNLDSDPQYDKNLACVFLLNYRNGLYFENCSDYKMLNNHFYETK